MFLRILLTCLIINSSAFAISSLESTYGSGKKTVNWYRNFINQMVREGKYFTSIPWFKDYIGKNLPFDPSLDTALARVVAHLGVSQFEYLPSKYLDNSNSATLAYIYAKKLMKRNQFSDALAKLNKIDNRHMLAPFIYHMKAVLYSAAGKNDQANVFFEDCIRTSESKANDSTFFSMQLNRDYCMVGLARNSYGQRKLEKAELQFLDISKSSKVWPELLYEEAWTSYYQNNYNRTLGKLVTYKAPVLSHFYGPKVEVLNAISYLKMCLYNDAKEISERFWNKYQGDYRSIRSLLSSRRSGHHYFYKLIVDYEGSGSSGRGYLESIFKSIKMDTRYQNLKRAFILGTQELKNISQYKNSSLGRLLSSKLEKSLEQQQEIIGAFVKKTLYEHYEELGNAFESMSYIKLEVLSQRKKQLYSFDSNTGKRGDVKYLERNEKQYFWSFNGEFWADELGDYVFALKSECN